MHAVTSSQIERLWSRFTSLDKQQKGFLSREDFLRIPGTDLSIQSRRMQSKDLTEQWAILIWVICEDVQHFLSLQSWPSTRWGTESCTPSSGTAPRGKTATAASPMKTMSAIGWTSPTSSASSRTSGHWRRTSKKTSSTGARRSLDVSCLVAWWNWQQLWLCTFTLGKKNKRIRPKS